MTEAQTLIFVIRITSIIIVIETIAVITMIVRMYKTLPRVSLLPLFMTAIVSILVGFYATLTGFGIWPIMANAIGVSTIRSLIMLLMGLPIWVMLAMYDAHCRDCPLRKES